MANGKPNTASDWHRRANRCLIRANHLIATCHPNGHHLADAAQWLRLAIHYIRTASRMERSQ